jgi:hypothetical protein
MVTGLVIDPGTARPGLAHRGPARRGLGHRAGRPNCLPDPGQDGARLADAGA